VNILIIIIDKIGCIIFGCLIALEFLNFSKIAELYKKLKSNSKIYAKSLKKINIKLIRGIGMALALMTVIRVGYNKLRIDYFIFIIVLLSSQSLNDLFWGMVSEELTEVGLITQDGFKNYDFVEGFSWRENEDTYSNTVMLQVRMRTKIKKLEFAISKDKKAEIDEFMQQKIKIAIKNSSK